MDIKKLLDYFSGLTLIELGVLIYIGVSSFDPETGELNLQMEQLGLLGFGGAAALTEAAKKSKPSSTVVETGAGLGEPDLTAIATLPSAESAPEGHTQPDPPTGDDAEDAGEHDLGILEYLSPENIRYQAEALRDTFLKSSTADSSSLGPEEKAAIAAGHRIPIEAWKRHDAGHWQINSQGQLYYLFADHFRLLGPDGGELGTAKPHQPRRPRTLVTGERIDLDEAIIPGGNFTWAEATRSGERMPESGAIVAQIKRIAQAMQDVRSLLGDRPITVTSWYRPPAVNRRVGGASQSRHLMGDGVDFVVAGIPALEVERRLDAWWGSRGGLASSRRHGFTHIDERNNGTRARWNY